MTFFNRLFAAHLAVFEALHNIKELGFVAGFIAIAAISSHSPSFPSELIQVVLNHKFDQFTQSILSFILQMFKSMLSFKMGFECSACRLGCIFEAFELSLA